MDSLTRRIKSSNIPSPVKRELRKQKKSLSNGEVQMKTIKKRGVYVEKKPNKIPAEGKPRKPTKQFDEAADIETILRNLSQSQGSSMCDKDPSTDSLPDEGYLRRPTRKRSFDNDVIDARGIFTEEIKTKGTTVEKQINSEVKYIMESQDRSFVEDLESTEPLNARTPSIYSEATYLSKYGNNESTSDEGKESLKAVIEQTIYNNIADRLTDAVFDRQLIATKRKKENGKKTELHQPVTLVGACENTDSLYNLFLDLLKNTISVYKIATDYAHNGQNESNTAIKEKKPKKVNAKKKYSFERKTKGTIKTTNKTKNTNTSSKICEKPLLPPVGKVSKSTSPATSSLSSKKSKINKINKPRNNVRFPHLTYNTYPVINMAEEPPVKPELIQGIRKQTKMISRGDNKEVKPKNKKSLLHTLKTQLQQDLLKEPQNLFEALLLMAENKRKSTYT
ncbi:hypothetical protein JYU34_008106 [Plutella xylostella]|uniref:Uncharacterized protein n=1 Tax=Plutella xylostella TaxID=51655 RepID=A0ABQ7QNT0_PLUXY|nr:hypothetical protein JYU34_008106 [Plutella xylostella]